MAQAALCRERILSRRLQKRSIEVLGSLQGSLQPAMHCHDCEIREIQLTDIDRQLTGQMSQCASPQEGRNLLEGRSRGRSRHRKRRRRRRHDSRHKEIEELKDLNERETAVEIRNQDALNDLIETLKRLSSLCVLQSTFTRNCFSAFFFAVPLHLRTLLTPEVLHPFFAEVSASERIYDLFLS